MLSFLLSLLLGVAVSIDFIDAGRLSVYRPGDGFNAGTLSCGGKFTYRQQHIAYRRWRKVGCGRRVLVYAVQTGRWAISEVQDSGPWGIYHGPLRRAKAEGRWKVWTKLTPPTGWKFRGAVDLSIGLWRRLGKPSFLSQVYLFFLERPAQT